MIQQNAWVRSSGSTLSAVMVEVECGTAVLYSRKEQAFRGKRDGERVYFVTIMVGEVSGE